MTLLCKSCNESKSTDKFSLRKDTGKFRPDCKKCWVSRSKDYQGKHYEERKLYYERWYEKNKESKQAKQNVYSSMNRDREASRAKKWRHENPDKLFNLNRAYYSKNRVSILEQKKEYLRNNTEAIKHNHRVQKARRRAVAVSTLTKIEWVEVLGKFNHLCAYCGTDKSITQDHVMPISRGGHHTKENVVPACFSCNASKGARTLEEWRRR